MLWSRCSFEYLSHLSFFLVKSYELELSSENLEVNLLAHFLHNYVDRHQTNIYQALSPGLRVAVDTKEYTLEPQ